MYVMMEYLSSSKGSYRFLPLRKAVGEGHIQYYSNEQCTFAQSALHHVFLVVVRIACYGVIHLYAFTLNHC